MNCPSLSELARVGSTEADPEVVAHLKTCDSCFLDWQIQLGTRYLSDPQIDAVGSGDLDERIVARATAIMRHSEGIPGWRHLAVAGLMAAAAAFAFVWMSMGGGVTVSVIDAATYALAGAIATACYLRWLDQRECSGFQHE